jgi:hypothetical protein
MKRRTPILQTAAYLVEAIQNECQRVLGCAESVVQLQGLDRRRPGFRRRVICALLARESRMMMTSGDDSGDSFAVLLELPMSSPSLPVVTFF